MRKAHRRRYWRGEGAAELILLVYYLGINGEAERVRGVQKKARRGPRSEAQRSALSEREQEGE